MLSGLWRFTRRSDLRGAGDEKTWSTGPGEAWRGLEWTADGLNQHDANDGDTNHGETHVEVWAISNKQYVCSKISPQYVDVL